MGGQSEFGIAVIVAGVFVSLACLITFNSIRLHCKHSRQPQIRNFTVRILLMIPVYGIEAWLAIYLSKHAVLFKVLREGYEAFVILSFMQLMLTYLGGPVTLSRDLASKKSVTPHMYPLCCMKPWKGASFVRQTLVGTLQYVPASLLVMVVSLSTWVAGKYKEGDVSVRTSWVYCAVITNCSQIWALYCLVLFYQATKGDLQPIHPLPKFLCVKLIIFFTWWQGIVIGMVTHYGWVRLSADTGTEKCLEAQLQNFIICIEMLFLAVAHSYAFPCAEFSQGYNPRSRAAALAGQWDSHHPSSVPTTSKHCTNGNSYGGDSPRSLPMRLVNGISDGISSNVEKLQRLSSGVSAGVGEMMSGVNILDIWRVLQQTQALDQLAQEDRVRTGFMNAGNTNAANANTTTTPGGGSNGRGDRTNESGALGTPISMAADLPLLVLHGTRAAELMQNDRSEELV